MRREIAPRTWLLVLPIAWLTLGGCSQPVPPEILAVRERLLVDQEPEGAVTIEEARKQVAEDSDLTLIVKVGNRNFVDWSAKDQALFYVSEGFPGSDYNVGPDHDASTCPFCKWKWKEEDSLAMIQVVDEEGEVLPHSAVSIFDLDPGRKITIEGEGLVDESGFLLVSLSRVFVHPQ